MDCCSVAMPVAHALPLFLDPCEITAYCLVVVCDSMLEDQLIDAILKGAPSSWQLVISTQRILVKRSFSLTGLRLCISREATRTTACAMWRGTPAAQNVTRVCQPAGDLAEVTRVPAAAAPVFYRTHTGTICLYITDPQSSVFIACISCFRLYVCSV